jgi:hypothetical protein
MIYPVVRVLAADGVVVATTWPDLEVSTSGFQGLDSRRPAMRTGSRPT